MVMSIVQLYFAILLKILNCTDLCKELKFCFDYFIWKLLSYSWFGISMGLDIMWTDFDGMGGGGVWSGAVATSTGAASIAAPSFWSSGPVPLCRILPKAD